MHRVCGRAQAPTAGLQHAPLALGDDDERVTRGLRIEGLAAAAASTFSRGSLSLLDRLPPPPSSARTARTCVRSRTTCTVRAARRAPRGRRTRGPRWAASSAAAPLAWLEGFRARLRCEEMLSCEGWYSHTGALRKQDWGGLVLFLSGF